MTNNKSAININFLHLIVVVIVIALSVLAASLWNQYRIQNKLSKMRAQTEKIYLAHQAEFLSTIQDDNRESYKHFLNEINIPEKGIYQISILVKDSAGFYRLEDRWDETRLSVEDTDKLKSLLSDNKTTSTSEKLSLNTYDWDNGLFAFTPIKNGDQVIGFVVVSVRRTQNL